MSSQKKRGDRSVASGNNSDNNSTTKLQDPLPGYILKALAEEIESNGG
jgi:hypothetical protein